MVESGLIDHANHAYGALSETLELERAVEVALAKVSLDDTLMIVTADLCDGGLCNTR